MAYGYKRKRRYTRKRRTFRRRRPGLSVPHRRYASSAGARARHRARVLGGGTSKPRYAFTPLGERLWEKAKRGVKRGADAAWEQGASAVKHHASRLAAHAFSMVAQHGAQVLHNRLVGPPSNRPPGLPPPAYTVTHPDPDEL